jgi:ATP-binding cassette subfamily G (WHITE) protein 2 (PDR)
MFMYRATPVTYFVSALISTGIGGVNIVCSRNELLTLSPPPGQTCGSYLAEYVSFAGGTLLNPDATSNCNFCAIASTNALFVTLDIDFADRWRNFGISLCYTAINVLGALGLFWVFRVPKGPKRM